MTDTRKAVLHRMVLADHICPFGVRAKQILQSEGFEVEDHILRTREEVDAFKVERGLATTPLIEIEWTGVVLILRLVGPSVGQRESPIITEECNPYFKKHGKRPGLLAFIDGATSAAIGAIAGVMVMLASLFTHRVDGCNNG